MRKVLVVCSRNMRRSLTAEVIFRLHPDVEVRSAGTSANARHTVSSKDVEWADAILFMERKHMEQLERLFGRDTLPLIKVAEIADVYEFMNEELKELLEAAILELAKGSELNNA